LKKKNINKALEEIKKADIILIQLEIPLKIVKQVISIGKEYGKKVILNPAPAQKLEDELYQDLYAIIPNETEAEIMTGVKVTDTESAKKAAMVFREKGVANVIITMGDKGAFVLSNDVSEIISSCKVEAVDTTAAGDTFSGAFVVGINNGMSLREAVEFANRSASLAVTKFGAQSSIPYLKDLELIYKEYSKS